MLDCLVSLLDDSYNVSWKASRASHVVFLCRMEETDTEDYSKIEKKIESEGPIHGNAQKCSNTGKIIGQKSQKSMLCTFFNQNTCSFSKTHKTRASYSITLHISFFSFFLGGGLLSTVA